ncbi:hypothetical protein H0X48_05085 [Candidatus Dependentiae bacterium]|nr:hypothetical protein [Candidatus Dependentiae bacterium]
MLQLSSLDIFKKFQELIKAGANLKLKVTSGWEKGSTLFDLLQSSYRGKDTLSEQEILDIITKAQVS